MKKSELRKIIREEVKKLKEQRSNTSRAEQIFYQQLGRPQTWDEVISSYERWYRTYNAQINTFFGGNANLMTPAELQRKPRPNTPPDPKTIWWYVIVVLGAGYHYEGWFTGD